jgi:hypothetical protein
LLTGYQGGFTFPDVDDSVNSESTALPQFGRARDFTLLSDANLFLARFAQGVLVRA